MMELNGMTAQDRDLAVLYWKLQRQVHTHPGIRSYLHALDRIIHERGIRPSYVNKVGMEMEREYVDD
jgi:hypothetical protein